MTNRDAISSTELYSENPSDYIMWYQRQMRFHEPTWHNFLDPDCKHCKGTGWMLVRLDEWDVEKDICYCAMNGMGVE